MSKRSHSRFYIFVCLCSLLVYGCSNYMKAGMKLSMNKYDEAIVLYQEYLTENPDHINARNKLGFAYLKTERFDEAISEFKTVLEKMEGEPHAILYLGMAYMSKEDFRKTIDTWQVFRNKNQPLVEEEINRLLPLLLMKECQLAAEKALAEEKKLMTVKPDNNTVAVCYYNDLSPDNSLRAFQKGLAAMLITDLSKIKSFKVVERIRLQALFEEMKLGQTGIVDAKTAPRVGRLLGAENLIVGALTIGSVSTTSSISSASNGNIKGTVSAKVSREKFYTLPGAIIKEIANIVGVELSPEEKAAILIPQTTNLKAFTYYGQALDAMDTGNWMEAKNLFTMAYREDPMFKLARDGKDHCPGSSTPAKSALMAMTPKVFSQQMQKYVTDAQDAQDAKDAKDAIEAARSTGGGDSGGGSSSSH